MTEQWNSSVTKIFKLIQLHEAQSNTENESVIIVIGITQCGKTVFINAIRGGKIIFDEKEIPRITNPNFVDAGKMGDRSGVSCTIFPKVYTIDATKLKIVDIQGTKETRLKDVIINGEIYNQEEIQISSSILLEMSIKKAKKISVVMVIDYNHFLNGVSGLQYEGNLLNNFFKSTKESLPIFFLFNRFASSNKKIFEKFITLKGQEKIDFVMERVSDIADVIDENKDDQKNMESFGLMKYNIKKGNSSYLDPEEEENIEILNQKLPNIESFPKDKIFIDNSSKIRIHFNNYCRLKLDESIKSITQAKLKAKFSVKFLNEIKCITVQSLNILDKTLKNLSSWSKSNELKDLSFFDGEIIKSKTLFDEFKFQVEKYQKSIRTCESNIVTYQSEIKTMQITKEKAESSVKTTQSNLDTIERQHYDKMNEINNDIKNLGSPNNSNTDRIHSLRSSLQKYEEEDRFPVYSYDFHGYESIQVNLPRVPKHIPRLTRITFENRNCNATRIRDTETSYQAYMTKDAIMFHEIKGTILFYAKKKDSPRYSNEYQKLKNQLDSLEYGETERRDQIRDKENEINNERSKYYDLIKKNRSEKEEKEKELKSIETDIIKRDILINQEKANIQNYSDDIKNAEKQIRYHSNRLDQLNQESYIAKFILQKNKYFNDIKQGIDEKYKIINNFPSDSDLSTEIESFMSISRKLDINNDKLSMIEKLRKQNTSNIYAFELINTNDPKLPSNLPDHIIFIEKMTNKKIQFDDFIAIINNDLNQI